MNLPLTIPRKRVMTFLIIITLLLTVINLFHQLSWYFWEQDYKLLMWRFDIGGDETVLTWFSSVLLLLCSLLLFVVARTGRNQPHPFTRHWKGLAFIFLALSIDETAALHEWSSSLLTSYQLTGIFYYSWVIFGIGLVMAVGGVYSRFYLHLPRYLKINFFLAALLYVGGALVVEMLNARYEFLFGADTLTYQAMTAVEELMEMAGVLIFINSLLQHPSIRLTSITLTWAVKERLIPVPDVPQYQHASPSVHPTNEVAS